MKRFWIIAALIALAVLIALVTLPARVAWYFASASAQNVQLAGLSGTFWRGSAKQTVVAGRDLGRLDWQISPWSLISFAPEMALRVQGGDVEFEARAKRGTQQLQLSAIRLSADAAWMAPALGIPALVPTGKLSANFGELVLDTRGLPLRARGNVQWLQAGVTGSAQANFGSYDVEIDNAQPSGITGKIQPLGDAELDIRGRFTFTGLNYAAEVNLTPKQPTEAMQRTLEFIGAPMPGVAGGRLLKITGTVVLPQ